MFMFLFHALDIFLNVIGATALFGFIYVFVGLQRSTLWSKQFKLFGYTFSLESTAGKQLKIEIKK